MVDVTNGVPEMKCTRHYAYYGELSTCANFTKTLSSFPMPTPYLDGKDYLLDQEMGSTPTSQMVLLSSIFMCFFVAGN